MSDITKHKFGDSWIEYQSHNNDELFLRTKCHPEAPDVILYKKDSIAIAKHFYNQLGLVERIRFLNSVSGLIPQSETIKHYPGAIGDMKRHD